jgi:type IV pilus assembly protein PilQ
MKRKILSILAALSLGSSSAFVARADEGSPAQESVRNQLSSVRVLREPVETVVRIEGSRAPVFSVYTLQDPLRVVVDVSQGDVEKLETPMDIDDGVITKVVAAQYGEGARAVGRVVIGFSRRVPYDIKAEGHAVVVRIAAVGKERPSEASLRERDRRIEEKSAELQKLRGALDARTQEAAAKTQEAAALAKAAADARSTAAEAERAKAEEATQRRALAERLANVEREAAELREKAAGSGELSSALEKARADVAKAAAELGTLRGELRARAEAERRAREDAALAAQSLSKARQDLEGLRAEAAKSGAVDRARADAVAAGREVAALRLEVSRAKEAELKARAEAKAALHGERAARDNDVRRLEGESKALYAKLEGAEHRVRELEALKGRVETLGNSEAAAKELVAHKQAEIGALQKKLEAAEGVARATAAELERVKSAEAARAREAEDTRAAAQRQNIKAREALSKGAAPAAVDARITLARGEVPTKARSVVVRNVDFKSKEGQSRVVLSVDGEPHYVVTRGERRLVLDLPGARLPSHLQRKLDVSEFGGPIATVAAYESASPVQATRVMVDLRGPASYEVTRSGQSLELAVKGTAGTARTPAAARPTLLAQAGAAKDEVPEVIEERKSSPKLRKRAKGKKPQYKGRRINLDLQDTDIHTVLKLISEVIRLNFVVSDDVKGKASLTLRDVPWDQALEIILKSKGLGYVREGNIIRVSTEKDLRKEAEEEAKKEVVVKESQPILLKIIPVNYAKVEDVMPRVRDVLSEKGAVSSDKRTNQLIVRDIQQRIRAAERLVKKLDTQTPQVLIEARIVEANTIFSREIGIQWGGSFEASPANGNPTGLVFPSTIGIGGGAPLGLSSAQGLLNPTTPNFGVNLPATVGLNQGGAVGFTFGSIGGTVNLNLRLSAAEENGQAKIISAPKITTLDNQKATIQQGVSIPISQASALGVNTIFVDANLTLTVTPHVTLDGSVIMDIVATKNEPDFQRTGGLGDPTILRKEARTSVLIKDGDTTVIGGIYTRNQSYNYRQVPFLSQIPILGWLFKKRLTQDNRTELLIFITPRIVNRPDSIGS